MALMCRVQKPSSFAGSCWARALSSRAAIVPKRGPIGHRPGDFLPSLAAMIPGLAQCKAIETAKLPWVTSAEEFFTTWRKIAPCLGKYQEFLSVHKGPQVGSNVPMDLKVMKRQLGGKTMSDVAQAAIAEFYLCVALQLRPDEIAEAGSDNRALLAVARKCAEEDFEPFIERARNLVADYDGEMHRTLEETCPLYEVDTGLFWHANFDVTSAAEFQHFLTTIGHGSGYGTQREPTYIKPKDVETRIAHISSSIHNDSAFEPARRASILVYTKWLAAASMPVKSAISKALMEHGLLVSKDVHDHGTLLPNVPALWPAPMAEGSV